MIWPSPAARRTAWLAPAASLTLGPAAAADDAQRRACVNAFEQGQFARREGKYLAARDHFTRCASSACPRVLTGDCARWLSEVEDRTPSVIVVALGPDGRDLSRADVWLDERRLPTPLSATAIDLDPGPHRLRVVADGAPAVEEQIVLREGEKLRRVTLALRPKAPPAPPPPPSPAPPPRREVERPTPALTYALGGVGLAALGVGGYFAYAGLSKRSDLDGCKPACSTGATAEARRDLLIGDVTLGAGALALGVAGALYLWRPEREVVGPAPSTSFVIAPAAGGALAGWAGSF
jgi:hypothetical protein